MKPKHFFKKLLIGTLGFPNFLLCTAMYRIVTLRLNPKEREFFFLLSRIPKNSVILDVGANIGYKTFFFAQLPGARVHSFEPIPENERTLKKIVDLFRIKNVQIHHCAVGDAEGVVEMVMPITDNVRAHAYCHVATASDPAEGLRFQVPLKRLDDVEPLLDHRDSISAIKIDVESFELLVLKGAAKILQGHKPLVYCEVNPQTRVDVFRFMHDLNYKSFKYQNGGLTEVLSEDQSPGDVFFIAH